MTAHDSIEYTIDRLDRIIAVNPAWDEFSRANDGAGSVSCDVIGRSLWEFIAGDTTKEIYRALLGRVREGRSISFTYRCDSPDCRRLLELHMSPVIDAVNASDQAVEFSSRTISVEHRPTVEWLARDRVASQELVRVCAWCKKLDLGGEWLEVEEAVARMRLFHRHGLPAMTHGICEACHAKMLKTVALT